MSIAYYWITRLLSFLLIYLLYKKVALTYYYHQLRRTHNCSSPPKYPHTDPILGLDLYRLTAARRLCGDYRATLQTFFDTHGETFIAHIFRQKIIYTCDVANIQAINTTHFDDFGVEGIRKAANASWIGDGVFVSDGPVWKHARKMVMPVFSRQSVVADLESFGRHVERMVEKVPRDGTVVDLAPLLRVLFLDSSTEFLFGESAETAFPQASKLDAQKFLKAFDRAMLGVDRRMSLRGLSFLWGRATNDREWKEACGEVQATVDRYIDRALAEQSNGNIDEGSEKRSDPDRRQRPSSFLHELIKETQDRQFIRDQIISVFFPARDANAIAISDLFFHLARNPHVWTKLRAEIFEHKEPVTFESLKSMKYLQAVLNESLRLIAPASVSRRTCIRTTTLPHGGGHSGTLPILVLPGTHIDSHFGIMHRDPKIWGPDASHFRPERWINGTNMRPGWTYVPFLGGGRICPAQQMVLCQMGYVLVRFVREFEKCICRDPVEEFVEEYNFSVKSRNGVKVGFI